MVFHGQHSFDQPKDQTECIKDWIRKRTGFEAQFKIRYYPGRYDTSLLGIFPIGDLTVYIPVEEVSSFRLAQILLPAYIHRANYYLRNLGQRSTTLYQQQLNPWLCITTPCAILNWQCTPTCDMDALW